MKKKQGAGKLRISIPGKEPIDVKGFANGVSIKIERQPKVVFKQGDAIGLSFEEKGYRHTIEATVNFAKSEKVEI